MGLWIAFTDALPEEIEEACHAAEHELARRKVNVADAAASAGAAAELPEDYAEERTPNADAVAAWYAAEQEAFNTLFKLTREWPAMATLIYTESAHGE